MFPPYEQIGTRIEWWGDTVERVTQFDPLTGEIVGELTETTIFPASHYVASDERMKRALGTIEEELHQRLRRARTIRASCSRPSGCACARRTTWR